jgi:CRP-like cAMP-binding protein
MGSAVTRVLLEDPDLGQDLSARRLEMAQRDLIAAVTDIVPGIWDPTAEAEPARGGIGLLIMDGLLVRRVGRGGRFGGEMLGEGDVLRPWQHDGEDAVLPFEVNWKVIQRTRVAVLGPHFTARLGPYPEVTARLVGRALRRSLVLAVNMAIVHHYRLERRLLLMLWHLADRWGRVTREGVVINLPITQELLADLVAAHRPSVTMALRALESAGVVGRSGRAWVLHGEPPESFEDLLTTEPTRAAAGE